MTNLFLDLTKKKIIKKPEQKKIIKLFLGGRGVNSYFFLKHLSPRIEPFHRENMLIFGAGLLTGMRAPSACRFTVTSRSPETGILGDSNCGGFWGPALKNAGYSCILISGKFEKPCYVLIKGGGVEIKDASHLWGLDCIETQEEIKKELGERKVRTVCIGPAGEKLVRFSSIRTDLKDAAGRTGMGAVMGSKNLKAISVVDDLRVENPKELLELSRELAEKIRGTGAYRALHKYGTPFLIDVLNSLGTLGVKNFQLNRSDDTDLLSGDVLVSEHSSGRKACFNCTVACQNEYELDGKTCGGPEFATLASLGPRCGNFDMKTVLRANDLCNRYGMDTISTGAIIAWAMECYEMGLITEKETKVKLRWGDGDAILKMINRISMREGFGDVLAEGGLLASRRIGKNSDKYLIHSKGLFTDPVDLRRNRGFALNAAVSSRGGDHLRGRPTLENLSLPEDMLGRMYGGKVSSKPESYVGKARMVVWSENFYAVTDSIGICRFVTIWNSPNLLNYEDFSKLINLATSIKVSPQELEIAGGRIINIERAINWQFGVRRKHDTLPDRFFEPAPCPPAKGERNDRKKFDKMLDEYYRLRGWGREGKPKSTAI